MKIRRLAIVVLTLCLSIFFSCKKSSMEATKWLVAGPDKELVEGLRQKAKRDSINRTPEQIAAIKKQQEENARIEQSRAEAIQQMRESGEEVANYYNDELETEEKWEMSYNQGLMLGVLMLAGFLFLIWWFVIRKIRNRMRDMSYMQGEVADKLDHAFKDPRFNDLSDEERASAEKMNAFLHRKT